MTPEVIYAFEDEDVSEAARIMMEQQIRRLVVLNQSKQLVGIISLGDLAVHTGDVEQAGRDLRGCLRALRTSTVKRRQRGGGRYIRAPVCRNPRLTSRACTCLAVLPSSERCFSSH